MKNKKFSGVKRSVFAVACVAANAGGAWAQSSVEDASANGIETRISQQEQPQVPGEFELPEGLDSLVAIDPVSTNLVRGTVAGIDEFGANTRQAQKGSGRGILEMPEGIKSITAIDAFNVLLVQTAPEAEETVQTRVNPLMAPIRQVRLDVRVIEAPRGAFVSPDLEVPDGLSYFGPFDSAVNLTSSVRSLQEGDKLETLLQSGMARVVNIGRVSSPGGKAATLRWETSSPATIRTKNANGAPLLQSTILTDSLLVTLTPTFRDGKIMVGMQTKSELTSEGDTPLIGFPRSLLSRRGINAFFSCKSGARQTLDGLWLNTAPNKDFAILPFGTVLNVDAPITAKNDAAPKEAAIENEIYIEVTASLPSPQTKAATK